MKRALCRTAFAMTAAVCMLCSAGGCAWVRALANSSGGGHQYATRLAEAANEAEQAGDLAEAESLWQEAARESPKDADPLSQLARLKLARGERDEAIAHLRTASALEPTNAHVRVQLAEALYAEGRLDEAATQCASSLENDTCNVNALLLRATLARKRNQTALALEAYHHVLALEPDHVEAQLGASEILVDSGRPDDAAPLLRAVCHNRAAQPSERATAHWLLGVAYGQQQRWSDAVEQLAEALGDRPQGTAEDRYRLAYARYRAGDLADADAEIDRILQIDSRHAAAQCLRRSLTERQSADSGAVMQVSHMPVPPPVPPGW